MTPARPDHDSKPARACTDCRHWTRTMNVYTGKCSALGGGYASFVREDFCHGDYWDPRPPRRSLRQWIYDTVWRVR
jgi:hypothetical protein